MNIATISKSEYKKLQKEQKYLRSELSLLREIVQKVVSEELTLAVAKRLLSRSHKMDKGGGIRFHSVQDVKKYLRRM